MQVIAKREIWSTLCMWHTARPSLAVSIKGQFTDPHRKPMERGWKGGGCNVLLEYLSCNGDGGVDWVGDDGHPCLRAVLGNCHAQVSHNACISQPATNFTPQDKIYQ